MTSVRKIRTFVLSHKCGQRHTRRYYMKVNKVTLPLVIIRENHFHMGDFLVIGRNGGCMPLVSKKITSPRYCVHSTPRKLTYSRCEWRDRRDACVTLPCHDRHLTWQPRLRDKKRELVAYANEAHSCGRSSPGS